MFDHDDLELAFQEISLQEQDAEALIYTINRDLIFKGTAGKQVNIPCDIIHPQLKRAENSAREALLAYNPAFNANLATANLGFVTSSHPYDAAHKTHNRRFITVPLHYAVDWNDPNKKHQFIAQIRDFWGKDETTVVTTTKAGKTCNKKRNPKQLKRQTRANTYANLDGINYGTEHTDYQFEEHYHSAGPKLENDFHHSEQTIFEMLELPEAIDYYIKHFLQAYNVTPSDKIYALILDIYTTRYMCQGCSGRAYSTAHYPGRSLLVKWEKYLTSYGYRVPKVGLRMAVRATGEQPALHQTALTPACYKQFSHQWQLNPGRATINSIVLEADAQHTNIASYNPFNDLFRRSVFLSRVGKMDRAVIQNKSISCFADFLAQQAMQQHNQDNILHHLRLPGDVNVHQLIASVTARLPGVIPATAADKKRQAQDIYLPGQAAALTENEFRGLYFI